MQNRWCSADEAGYVALNGGWTCRRCGCTNEGCDVCSRCGWNMAQGCGCQGGVVASETTSAHHRSVGCEAAQACGDNGWAFARCGCRNVNCDMCTRCGCQGGSVASETASACETTCGYAQTRQSSCPACPAEGGMYHAVQCCPANTSLRPSASAVAAGYAGCGCGCARTAGRCGGASAVSGEASGTLNHCGCAACENAGRAVRQYDCPVAAGVGMVYAVKQELGDVYQPESALRTGTLFPELHKPMNGRCPGSCNASTTGQQSAFSAWDLRLYLDTHPDDAEARALFAQLAREAEEPCYATTFLSGGPGWGWTDEPWPWEYRGNNA